MCQSYLISQLCAIAIAVVAQSPVMANTVTVGFNELPQLPGNQDFLSQHVLFSPSCHYHLMNHYTDMLNSAPAPYGKYLAFDQSGCQDDPNPQYDNYYNHNYLGPSGWQPNAAKMFVALEFGGVFTLESFVYASFDSSGSYQVISSKGGARTIDASEGNFSLKEFSGDEWTGITWLEFLRPAGGSDVQRGFDNLRLRSNEIPEPASYGLGILALMAAGAASARRRK